jgi:hypothetical protein
MSLAHLFTQALALNFVLPLVFPVPSRKIMMVGSRRSK